MRGWLRRNRWGVIALPLTAVLAVGTNSQRLHDYWWDTELRTVGVSGQQGEWVEYSEEFTDAAGEGTRTLELRVGELEETDSVLSYGEPTALPVSDEVVAWEVPLEFRARPDQVLSGCNLALVDDEDNRYEYVATVGEVSQSFTPCLDADRPGPSPSITRGEPRKVAEGEERPGTWTTRPVILVPRGVTPTKAILWWQPPRHLQVRLK